VIFEDRDPGAAERDLGRLDGPAQIGGEHCGDAVVAAALAELARVLAATLRELPGKPAGRDAPFVVDGRRVRLEDDLDAQP
jgi:hypothetical protein